MGFIEKMKLLFKIKGPVGDVLAAAKDAKKDRKWLHFTVVLLGSLIATAGALTGVIPPQAQLIAVTILNCLYNIIRGADKAEVAEIKGTFRTTEFWMTALGELQKGFVAFQTGGWYPELMAGMAAVSGAFLAAGQNLSTRNVKTEK